MQKKHYNLKTSHLLTDKHMEKKNIAMYLVFFIILIKVFISEILSHESFSTETNVLN